MTVGITELPPEGMQLGGVALAGDAERGTKTTEGLSLLFTSAGITVQGPQPQIERLLVWSGLDSAACNEKVELSDGRSAAVMELTSGGQSIRFLLPTETVSPGQAAYLDQALPAWLARYRATGNQSTSATGAVAETGDSGSSAPSVAAANAGPVETGANDGLADLPSAPRMSPAAAGGVAAAATAGAAGAAATGGFSNGAAEEVGEPTRSMPPVDAPPPPTQAAAPPPPTQAAAPPPPTQAAAPPPPTQSAPPPPSPTPAAAPPPTQTAPSPPTQTAPPTPTQAAPPPMQTAPPPPTQTAPPPPSPTPAAAPPPPPTQAGAPPPPPNVEGRPAPPPGVVGAPLPPSGFEGLGTTAPPTNAWDLLGDASPAPTAWDNPPLGQAPPPAKKKRFGKRTKPAAEQTAAAAGMFAVATPPSEPPEEPVPLHMTLPPPSVKDGPARPARGGFRWRPQSRDKSKVEPEPQPEPQPILPVDPQVAAFATPEHESVTGLPTAPGEVVVLSAAAAKKRKKDKRKGDKEERHPEREVSGGQRRRQMTVLILVLLLVVIGGIAYFVVKKNNNNSTTTSSPPVTSAVAADAALATSINLRLSDLPAGWSALSPTVPPARPLAAPVEAQRTADTALAGCLGVAVQTTSALFGGTTIAGDMAPAESPTFQDVSATGFQMHSTTTVFTSAAEVQSLAAPFASATFTPCYAQHQSAIVAAASPGSVAQLQVVTLQAPPGVKAYGYLTDITTATGGKEVVGQAFMFGGRVASVLEPTTDGPPVPTSAFVPAFDAMAGRIAGASSR